MNKLQHSVLIFLSIFLLFNAQETRAQMEEVRVIGHKYNGQLYDLEDWWRFKANNMDIFGRDLEEADQIEDRENNQYACDHLRITKPEQCTRDPGNLSNFIASFSASLAFPEGVSTYQNLLQPALMAAAQHFVAYQDSLAATNVFFNDAVSACMTKGREISGRALFPVTNEVICIGHVEDLAEGMNTNFSAPSGISISFTLLPLPLGFTAPLDFGPWGNAFYGGLTKFTACKAWYSLFEANQC